jgi:hypothetical protein
MSLFSGNPIVFEMRFEDGFEGAREWLYTASTQEARVSKDEAA